MKKIIIAVIAVLAILFISLGGFFLFKNLNSNIAENTFGKVLIVYFSIAGKQSDVGMIKEGNTAVIAKMIAQKTNGDLVEIWTEKGHYPPMHSDLLEFAKKEKEQNARPKIINKIQNFDEYDTIFIGYPNWFNDMPMPVYTFIEGYDFSNKKVYHFCTYGSTGGVKKDGFAISGKIAQTNRIQADKEVSKWLKSLK